MPSTPFKEWIMDSLEVAKISTLSLFNLILKREYQFLMFAHVYNYGVNDAVSSTEMCLLKITYDTLTKDRLQSWDFISLCRHICENP